MGVYSKEKDRDDKEKRNISQQDDQVVIEGKKSLKLTGNTKIAQNGES